jgi:hypothetical protein
VKPEDLLNPEKLPAEFHWLISEFKLHPKDPVFVLIAWHWSQTQQAENTLLAAKMEFKAALDTRLKEFAQAVGRVESLPGKLSALQAALTPKPEEFAKKLDQALRPGLDAATANIRAVEQSSAKLLQSARAAHATVQRREVLAALVAGIAFGVTVAVLVFAA